MPNLKDYCSRVNNVKQTIEDLQEEMIEAVKVSESNRPIQLL